VGLGKGLNCSRARHKVLAAFVDADLNWGRDINHTIKIKMCEGPDIDPESTGV